MKTEMVNGKRIKCYDNGGRSCDRYTVAYLDWDMDRGLYSGVGMSALPFNPQGFGQHCTMKLGRHLGKRIMFKDLPPDCQKLVTQDQTEE